MANEITYRGSLAYAKGDADAFDFGDLTATMTGTKALRGRQTAGTSEEPLVLGEVPAGLAWFICKNMDATNSLRIKPAAAAGVLVEVPPGETAGPFRFVSTATAPQVQSTAGNVDFIYMIVAA